MLQIKNFSCILTNKKAILKNSTVNFHHGVVNLLAGANGTGKSTLLNIIRGNIANYGSVSGTLVHNEKSYNLATNNRPRTGYVVQRYRDMLVPTMTVAQNIAAARMSHRPGLTPLPPVDDLIQQLEQFGIPADRLVQSLSGGQQQILTIMMTLVHQVDILLLDEPTAALDEENTTIVMQFLRNLSVQANCYIIMVTHDQGLLNSANKEDVHLMHEIQKAAE
jgi:ABC-type lipoprotein export system ATPase subunit